MACLADLPEHRREALLWRFALELDYEGVDDRVAAGAGAACFVEGMDLRAVVAVLGDDGRYHLRNQQAGSAAEVLCGVERRRRPGEFGHEHWCSFWTEGTGYRIQAPPNLDRDRAERGYYSRTVQWTVRLTETVIAAELVPPTGRCPTRYSRTVWPAHVNSTTPRGRLRSRLVTEFGPLCQACRRTPAFAIDHDHFTGRVRGLLCRNCNNLVDQCVHVSGCLWADYLNHPPAAHLRFTVPNRPISRGDLARIDYLGFNPFPSGVAPS